MADEFTKAALYWIKTFNKKVKEKIWMEKLIELLCEYLWEEYHWEYFEWYRDIEIPQRLDSLSELKPFIKWLVENDKIDNKKIADETYVKVNWEWYELILGCHYDLYQQTLMLLAIQDEPIRFLCEILK